jgi:elongation factor G
MDRERADFARTVEDLAKNFSDTAILPVQIPIGSEDSFKGIIDLLAMEAYIYKNDGSGQYEKTAIPADLVEEANDTGKGS